MQPEATKPVRQHTLLESILYHLVPGILIGTVYALIVPAIRAAGYPSVMALALTAIFVLVPIELGVLGWWYRGKITKQQAIGRLGLKVFNILVPIFKLIDPLLPWKGLSLVVVARKPENPKTFI